MGTTQKIQYGAKKKAIWGYNWKYQRPHDESPHGGGRWRRHHHKVRGGRRPPYIMWAAGIFRICLRLYFLLWSHTVFSASAPCCIVFLGRLGPQINAFQLPCDLGSILGGGVRFTKMCSPRRAGKGTSKNVWVSLMVQRFSRKKKHRCRWTHPRHVWKVFVPFKSLGFRLAGPNLHSATHPQEFKNH